MEAPTRVARRPRAAAPENAAPRQPAPRQAAPRQSAPAMADRAGYGGWAIFVAVLAILAVVVLPRLLGGDRGLPGASPEASADATASASAMASPTALQSDGETVRAALDRVDAAILEARGGKDGLTGRDEDELAELAAAVRRAADRGDLDAAATAAQALSDRARVVTIGLDGPRRNSLLATIDDLLAALPPP